MRCERCGGDLVEVDNPMRREFRHRRGVVCTPVQGDVGRGREIAESMVDRATAEYRRGLAEEGSAVPHAPAVEAVGAVSGPERLKARTDVLKPSEAVHTIDGRQLSGREVISRVLVLAFGTRHNREHIGEIADHLDAALRPVHYREAAASLRKIADADEKADPPIGGESALLRHFRLAADLIDSVARDLDEEGT